MSKWEKAGVVGVDAGMLWLGDPCYCVTPDANNHPAKTWKEFCEKVGNKDVIQFNYAIGRPGLGVVVHTGNGDGEYDVFIKKSKNGRIAEVKTVFINEEEQSEDVDFSED